MFTPLPTNCWVPTYFWRWRNTLFSCVSILELSMLQRIGPNQGLHLQPYLIWCVTKQIDMNMRERVWEGKKGKPDGTVWGLIFFSIQGL